MKDRAGFFAGCADLLTWLCVYYAVGGVLVIGQDGWGVHLGWILLWGLSCAFLFSRLLRQPKTVPFLTAVTCGLFAAAMGLFILVSKTPMRFGYGFVLAVGAGMASGMPLYYGLNRPLIHKHLTCLDVLILTLAGVLLCASTLGIDTVTVALMVIVLLMDAAAAVGLRMTEGGGEDTADAFKATVVALAAALLVFLLIALLVSVFSRSGDITGTVLHGIGAFFASVGRGTEGFFRWLASLLYKPRRYEEIQVEELAPSVANAQPGGEAMSLSVNTTAVTVVLAVLALAAALCVALFLRRKTVARTVDAVNSSEHTVTRRRGSNLKTLWKKLLRELCFRWTVFRARNTPAGILQLLERVGKGKHTPRQAGETMRSFICRMDKKGGLAPLADALDREYYGGCGRVMEPRQCRTMRKYIRKEIMHG